MSIQCHVSQINSRGLESNANTENAMELRVLSEGLAQLRLTELIPYRFGGSDSRTLVPCCGCKTSKENRCVVSKSFVLNDV